MSYYPPQGSYVPQPVAYSSSHHGHGYETYPASQAQYASGYYAGQPTYATSAATPVVIAPSSSRRSHRSHRSHRSRSPSRSRHGHGHSHSRRHHRHHSSTPQVISTGGSTVAYANTAAYPQVYSGQYGPRLSFTDRLRRFFGLSPRSVGGVKYKHQGKYSSWGFLGRSKRPRYVDARTGAEVDKRGRPIYRM
ncbi:hypothetical protein BDN71DRAFT_1503869 [Pleurotus eryngii]|uniref:Uncharacterized protein n=1 Tax=Pleurotus eryngii TaxID=5323 RepID=A0A9P6A1H7_PLEER|nr:hypothetical protein BDN71DRAFT_1503869 [Pleurotus eryngii]